MADIKENTAIPMESELTQSSPRTTHEGPPAVSCEAISSLLCAILGVFVVVLIGRTGLTLLFGPIAIGLGMCAKSKIKKNPAEHGGQCLATAGIIIGAVSVVLFIILIILVMWVIPDSDYTCSGSSQRPGCQ